MLLGALALSACTRPAFTRGVRDQLSLSVGSLERLQFFTAEDIVLERESLRQAREVSAGGVQVVDELKVEEVLIPAGTPGVAIRVERDHLLIAFASDDRRQALWFAAAPQPGEDFAPDAQRYALVELDNGPDEPGPFVPRPSTGFLIAWAGQTYRVVHGRGAHLAYELSSSFQRERVRTEAKGWRLEQPRSSPSAPAQPSAAPAPSSAPAVAPQMP